MSIHPSTADTAERELAALREKVEMLMAERVTPAVSALADRAENLAHGAADSVRQQSARVTEAVREQPLTALGTAVVVGFVLALLMRR